jgi:hypothetical protein
MNKKSEDEEPHASDERIRSKNKSKRGNIVFPFSQKMNQNEFT